jgi:hypothetical protein
MSIMISNYMPEETGTNNLDTTFFDSFSRIK